MEILNRVVSMLKKIFMKEEIKEIEESKNIIPIIEKESFVNKLKENVVDTKNKKVETLICFGDGLGIQTKISS